MRAGSHALWIAAAVMAVVVPVLTFAVRSGQCWDVGYGGVTSCTSEPVVGWPGAWLITVACALLLGVSVHRLVRRDRRPAVG